ncbi:GlxA family transcriptional regulator [Nocardia sp. NPDC003345]
MHRVVALVRPVQSTFELGCAVEVFGTERAGIPQHYEFEVCAETPGQVPTSAGYTISVARDLAALETADTVILPGWAPVESPLPGSVRDALLRAHARGARLVTICSGVFALARTGLLDHRTATTHWARADRLQRQFPRVRVEAGRRFIDHGDVATSAGAGAGIELCLHLVGRDHGPAHADLIRRHMALPPHPGDSTPPPTDPFDDLLTWASAHLADPLSVDDLAARLGVSPRTLSRRFADRLDTTPGAWLRGSRVAQARALLEDTDLPVEAVATRVGLVSAVNLRRRFRVLVGTTPGEYRRGFRDRPNRDGSDPRRPRPAQP